MDSGNFSSLNNSRNGTNDRIMVEISFINWEWHGVFFTGDNGVVLTSTRRYVEI